MKIEDSYLAVSGLFDLWVRLMAIRTRLMEVQDARINDLRILIISPPTYLLCFSETLAEIAKDYSIQHNIEDLKICVEPFFSIPFDDSHFDAVFANCFFDFCQQSDFNDILKEIKRALKSNGLFFSVYMEVPTDLIGRTWVKLFGRFQSLSQGCHPVDIIPSLSKWSFKLKKDLTIRRLGFPVKYLIAER
jgi:SAM-dependent methyltransferase